MSPLCFVMLYLLKNIISPIEETPDFRLLIYYKFGIHQNKISSYTILKRSIDARKKNHLQYVFTLLVDTSKPLKKHQDIFEYKPTEQSITPSTILTNPNPFIIGMGPAGLFAALKLVENGFKPYLFDQGDSIEKRQEKVKKFWVTKELDPLSNVQFGEGGAGAFSDGKLTARSRNIYTEQVFEYLIKFGAKSDIMIDALPHIGTDDLIIIIQEIKIYLIESGCRFFYNHKLENIEIKNNKITSVKINNQIYSPEIVILAIGNSARETFKLLHAKAIALESKAYAIGLRIEHPLDFINKIFYGEKNDFNITGPATYKLISKHNNRSIYSFCMCPGGYVIPAHSELDGQIVNGMSYSGRDNAFSNSALVVNINHDEFGNDVFNGMDFQKQIERDLFDNFIAPAQNVNDFIANKKGLTKQLKSNSYFFETKTVNFHEQLPNFICKSLSSALSEFDYKYKGFASNGLFLGIETRTSSPVRILRDSDKLCSTNISNLYPIGEGSGYAGGIISSASDGVKIGDMFTI